MSLLTILIFFPVLGVLALIVLPKEGRSTILWTAMITALAEFGISLLVLARFSTSSPALQMLVDYPWIRVADFQISFQLGIDGISILLVLLTTLLTVLAVLFSWGTVKENLKTYMIFFLLLEVGMLGVFLSLDLFLFYIFWEFSLVPMYFLIGIWGHKRKVYAAVKFFLYTMAGSILMLLAILWLGIEGRSFSLINLLASLDIPADVQVWLFLAFAIAFAIKVPMWPFHSWLPDAHTEAPTAGSVILAGVLLKMGAYGFLRFNLSLFPSATMQLAPWLAGLAVVGIIYGAILSYPQPDMKKLVAFSSVSHMGFVILGMFALNQEGISGSILQMVNHGISTGALFLIVGLIYERTHTRQMDEMGGLWKVMPVLATLSLVVSLSSMALPGLNGFVGEFTILLGAYSSQALGSPWFTAIAVVGVILAAIYILTMFQKVFMGPVTKDSNKSLPDLSWTEIAMLAPLVVLIFWIGMYPAPFFRLMEPTVAKLVSSLGAAPMAILP